MTSVPPSRRVLLALAALATAAALSACGSSSNTTTTSASAASAAGGSANRATLAACLRQHGVTLPSSNGAPPSGAPGGGAPPSGAASGGFPGAGAGGGKFQAAIKACGGKLPRQSRAGVPRQAISKYVSCVRRHGYQLPQPNFSGSGPVFPASIQSNKKFQAASKACQSVLTPARTPTSPGA